MIQGNAWMKNSTKVGVWKKVGGFRSIRDWIVPACFFSLSHQPVAQRKTRLSQMTKKKMWWRVEEVSRGVWMPRIGGQAGEHWPPVEGKMKPRAISMFFSSADSGRWMIRCLWFVFSDSTDDSVRRWVETDRRCDKGKVKAEVIRPLCLSTFAWVAWGSLTRVGRVGGVAGYEFAGPVQVLRWLRGHIPIEDHT